MSPNYNISQAEVQTLTGLDADGFPIPKKEKTMTVRV